MKKATGEQRYEYYQKQIDRIDKTTDIIQSRLDNKAFSIAAGAIALTVTFYGNIVTKTNSTCIWLMKSSWLFLLASIITLIISHVFALKSHNLGRSKLNTWALGTSDKTPNLKNFWYYIGLFFDYLAYLFLIIGLLFMLWFAWRSIDLQFLR